MDDLGLVPSVAEPDAKSIYDCRHRRVTAVVVTYYPQPAVMLDMIRATTAQVEGIIIVDNASPEGALDFLPTSDQIKVVRLDDNEGVAAAQNVGILEAKRSGATHVLLLDQDSLPSSDMVARLVDALDTLVAGGERVAVVGPRWTNILSGQRRPFSPLDRLTSSDRSAPAHSRCVECDCLISAGSLIPIAVVDDVGLMEAGLFIDLVDTEWCLRAQSRGYRVYGVDGAELNQTLGDVPHRIWLLGWRKVVSHKPFRYYYIFRNSMLVSKRDYVRTDWKRWNFVVLAVLLGVHGLLVGPRVENVAMMWRGLLDGVRGVTGRLNVSHTGATLQAHPAD